jgi:hypothetical protein
VISRAAGLLAGFSQTLAIRRSGGDPGAAERVFQGKQRETAISLVETTVHYVAFGAALAAAIVVVVGSRRIGAIAGASFVAVVLAFALQRLLIDILQGLFTFFEGWFAVGALDEGLFRLTATAAVPPGREWLAQDLLPSLMRERASEGLIVHGLVIVPTDEQAARRFARIVQVCRCARRRGGRAYRSCLVRRVR